MKKYFHYFRVWFIVLAALLVVYGAMAAGSVLTKKERTNTECLTTQRVFDYGDILTDEEEEKLEALISKVEKKVEIDIVLVVLNESLEEYAASMGADVPISNYVKVYAEDFLCKNHFGYDIPTEGEWDRPVQDGDAVILVDNWYRESDGKVYTWFSAFGTIYDEYGYNKIDRVLDAVYKYIETNPYKAYRAYIKQIERDNKGHFSFESEGAILLILGMSFVAAIIYIVINMKPNVGKKTVNANTYVPAGNVKMRSKQDEFLRKHVTTRVIQSSSSSGGRGGHSGGGGSRGRSGGGRSR